MHSTRGVKRPKKGCERDTSCDLNLFHSRSDQCYFQFFNEFAERNIQSKGKKEKKRKLKERLKKRRADEEQTGKRVRPEVQPEVKPEDNLPTYTTPELQWVRTQTFFMF